MADPYAEAENVQRLMHLVDEYKARYPVKLKVLSDTVLKFKSRVVFRYQTVGFMLLTLFCPLIFKFCLKSSVHCFQACNVKIGNR